MPFFLQDISVLYKRNPDNQIWWLSLSKPQGKRKNESALWSFAPKGPRFCFAKLAGWIWAWSGVVVELVETTAKSRGTDLHFWQSQKWPSSHSELADESLTLAWSGGSAQIC